MGFNIEKLISERLGGETFFTKQGSYKFAKIKQLRVEFAKNSSQTLLDFSIGENEEIAHDIVRTAMKEEIDKSENRGYADNGIDEYREAVISWMKRNFHVDLDKSSVLHCVGSKSGLSLIPLAFINPGDYTIMTTPAYPVLGTHTEYLGGKVHRLPLTKENNFLPDLDSVPADVLEKAKILLLNYPNSPTGKAAPKEFFEKVVKFCKKNNIIAINDAAHMMLTYNNRPTSFLETEGAMDIGLEIHSMSKGFNMIGWRLGFIVGQSKLIKAIGDVKDNSDSGQFIAIQKSAAKALENDFIHRDINQKYERRLKNLVQILKDCGFKAEMSEGTYFLYIETPKGTESGEVFKDAEEFTGFLINKLGVVTVPWDDAGAFTRFSVTYPLGKDLPSEEAYMSELKRRLSEYKYVW